MNAMEKELYSIRFRKEELKRKNDIWKILTQHFLQQFVSEADTIMDVACGYGEFINNIRAKRKIAIDMNPDAQSFLTDTVEFFNGDVIDGLAAHPDTADVIFTSNFLEHLSDKTALEHFLDKVLISLKPGGKYLILGPNLRYLPGKYWDFYDHELGLTHLSLSEILQLKKFDISVCIDKFLPFTTKCRLPTHPFLVRIYLGFPLAWRILGTQFFIVAQRPA